MLMKQSPYQLHPRQFIFKFKFLYYAPHQETNMCVFQTSLHMKRKLTLRNMNGGLYCCYRKSLPHRQTHTRVRTHNMYNIITLNTPL